MEQEIRNKIVSFEKETGFTVMGIEYQPLDLDRYNNLIDRYVEINIKYL